MSALRVPPQWTEKSRLRSSDHPQTRPALSAERGTCRYSSPFRHGSRVSKHTASFRREADVYRIFTWPHGGARSRQHIGHRTALQCGSNGAHAGSRLVRPLPHRNFDTTSLLKVSSEPLSIIDNQMMRDEDPIA